MCWREVDSVPGWDSSLYTCSSCEVSRVSRTLGSLDAEEEGWGGAGPSGEGQRGRGTGPRPIGSGCYAWCLVGEGPAGRHCETRGEQQAKITAVLFSFFFLVGIGVYCFKCAQ